jgi:hypothetical protein
VFTLLTNRRYTPVLRVDWAVRSYLGSGLVQSSRSAHARFYINNSNGEKPDVWGLSTIALGRRLWVKHLQKSLFEHSSRFAVDCYKTDFAILHVILERLEHLA